MTTTTESPEIDEAMFRKMFTQSIKPLDREIFNAAMHGVELRLTAVENSVSDLRHEVTALRTETKDDTKSFRSELKTDIVGFRDELKTDIAELRTELKADIAGLRDDHKSLRSELKGDIAEFRSELKGDIAGLRSELKGDINDIKGSFARQSQLLVLTIAALALFIAVLKFIDRSFVLSLFGVQ
ncbi:MAG: CCDC90 family protein [Planctomycetota bacterium]|jgi:predicted  nucleic acid-binding Zn-ribbon protein|nr:CCDC90 family protein [Planctomycetota bacterium]